MNERAVRIFDVLDDLMRGVVMIVPKQDQCADQFLLVR
jgi:hypothetical protein